MSSRASWYTVTLTAQQPVSLGRSGPRGYLTPTHPYIPGSVVRGALASAWIAAHGTPDDLFEDTFDRRIRFGPAFPDGLTLVPQSVHLCKYHQSGAPHAASYDEALLNPGEVLPEPCGAWDRSKGEPSWPHASLVSASALTPGTLSVSDGQLYSRETLPAGTIFRGHLVATHTPDSRLLDMMGAFVGGKSSVLGHVTISITEAAPPTPPTTHDWYLVSTAPTILIDEAGRPTSDCTFALGLAGITSPVHRIGSRIQTEGTGGWHAASGLPKPADVAIAPGMVLKLDDAEAAARLLDHGLGLRRPEGYGWLTIASPWQPTTATQSLPARSAAREWVAAVTDLQLAAGAAQWLENQLREINPGERQRIDQALDEPAAHALSLHQRQQISKILLEVPTDLRAPLAHTLRKVT